MITLAAPWALALLPLPLLVRRLFPEHREERDAVRSPFVGVLAELLGEQPQPGAVILRRRRLQAGLFVAVWVLLVAALANPQWIGEPVTRTVPTRDLLLAVDLSGSMEVADFHNPDGVALTRLDAVKQVLDEFLARREGDRVGLIFFGTAAFVQAPFTEDLEVCALLLDEAQARMAGPKTALGDALGLAITVFEESVVQDRVLILLTDGNDTGSTVPPARAASIAAARGITVHTVAVGDPSAAGEEPLDEEALRDIARLTGGVHAHAGDLRELDAVYVRLDALDVREIETQSHRPQASLFHWPLLALLLLTLALHGLITLPAWLRLRRHERDQRLAG